MILRWLTEPWPTRKTVRIVGDLLTGNPNPCTANIDSAIRTAFDDVVSVCNGQRILEKPLVLVIIYLTHHDTRGRIGGMTTNFYEPTKEHLTRLSLPWRASYSGGKDSTSLLTWLEYLRRVGWIDVSNPQAVRSDTTVEEGELVAVAQELTDVLAPSGWAIAVVVPDVHERLYPQILGRGLPPIHPGVRRMRWCTRSTKIDPMKRNYHPGGLTLTGLRLGESAMRDGKLKKSSCAAGGECGIPDPGEGNYSPILNWRTCQVIDWLNGLVDKSVRDVMGDVFEVTRKLVAIYGVRIGQPTFAEFGEPEIIAARYGCRGCPAIGAEEDAPKSVVRRNGVGHPFNELYGVWHFARRAENRLVRVKNGKVQMGPIRMAVRPILFNMVMDIQTRAGIVLISDEDEAFIRKCWKDSVYPRSWSSADEMTVAPWNAPLFPLSVIDVIE